MLSKIQKILLAELVLHKKNILFSSFSPSITKELKNSTWQNILQELRSAGALLKDFQQVRDKEWPNLKNSVMKRYQESLKSGAEGKDLSKLDNLVMDILDRESPKIKGLDVDDMRVHFGPQETNSEDEFQFIRPAVPTQDPLNVSLNFSGKR
jgi:hypothetical protein